MSLPFKGAKVIEVLSISRLFGSFSPLNFTTRIERLPINVGLALYSCVSLFTAVFCCVYDNDADCFFFVKSLYFWLLFLTNLVK